jgi:peroxiredoxin
MLTGCAVDGQKLIGTPAPETRFTLLEGDYVPLKRYRGKTTVLIFWAQWCHSSGPTMKRLQEFSEKMQRSDVVFLAASLDEVKDVGKLRERIVYQDLDNFQHAFSGNAGSDEAFIAFEGGRLPYIVVIDPKGVVVAAGNSDSVVYEHFEEK